jgi:hypothetical protein
MRYAGIINRIKEVRGRYEWRAPSLSHLSLLTLSLLFFYHPGTKFNPNAQRLFSFGTDRGSAR